MLTRLKEFPTTLPVLTSLAKGEILLLYTMATPRTVSVALIMKWEEEGHDLMAQCPVYFVSEVLSDSKTCYLKVQKLLYAMLVTKRKLWYYFDSHLMVVVSSISLGDIINN